MHRMLVRLLKLMSVLACATWASAAPARAPYVVATDGSDANPGTLDRPWRTLGKALSALEPGDTLYVRGGTYRERLRDVALRPGTDADTIRVAAYRGERPVLKGLLWLKSPSYWAFEGLNVTWDEETGKQDEHMVKLGNGVGWVFKDAEVWGARSYAAVLVYSTVANEPRNWAIRGCCIHGTQMTNEVNQDQLIYCNSGLSGSGGVIERNLLFDAPNGAGVKLGGPRSDSGGAARVQVRYNTIYNTAQAVIVAWQAHGNTIYRNILSKVGPRYGAIRGFRLVGRENVARENLVSEARGLILNDRGYPGIEDGGGNQFPIDPQFNTTQCGGFRPQNPAAEVYGRYAPDGQ